MKRSLITLITVALFAGVGSAATYSLEDYLPNFGFDEATSADWTPLSSAGVNGWQSYADQSYTWSAYSTVGTEIAYTGDKVIAFGNVADTGQPVSDIRATVNSWMSIGDTWTFSIAYQIQDGASPATFSIAMYKDGSEYGRTEILSTEVTDSWQILEYSYTHAEAEAWWPNAWQVRMTSTTPNGIGAGGGGLYVDMVPEPATMAMFGSGALLALIRRRNK